MPLTKCPGCESRVIFARINVLVEFKPVEQFGNDAQIAAHCSTSGCGQRFWYFPYSKRITRRNSGPVRP